ncbi:MAG: YbaB/EbfC family nucleoid-associated protein [Armatimonadetes bacterium]|nr:YbaB/EbfC family nucleoid-associated protein [Armatimonadota bacterium]
MANPFKNMGGMGGFGDLIKQAQKMAEDARRIDEELEDEKLETSSGGGMVTAVVNGKGQLLDITINPEVVDPEDVEMLQDLIVSAVREALESAEALRTERLSAVTGGMGLPGGMGIPGLG